MDDAEEIARLRARVAELEAERAAPGPTGHRTGQTATRSFLAATLVVLGCLLAPLAVVSVWASTVVSDTERYVETVAPIADDPGVQAAIADEVTTAILDRLDVDELTTEALETLAEQENMPPRVADALPALAAPLSRGIEGFTRDQAANLLASDEFETIWDEANRAAHDQVVALLEGDQSGALTAQDDQITLNLAPIIEEVKARLVDRGFALAERIPTIDKTFVLVESDGITRAQQYYSFLNALGLWLPFVALGVLAAGVLLARDRRRALLRGSLGVAGTMLALGVVLALVRMTYVETTPLDILSAESAGNVFDTLVRFLRTGLRATGVLFLLIALAAFLTGPSSAAVRTRAVFDRGVGSARAGADAAGWHLDPLGGWVHRHRGALRLATFIAGGLVLMFWSQPTAGVVLVVALLVVLALTVISFLGRPPAPGPAATGPAPTGAPDAHAATLGHEDRGPLATAGSAQHSGRGPDRPPGELR